ncbi:MAG: DinB family protein [Chloroflexota bacterium]|nr:DinB family protein [Chloroflexota bacterium]
MTDNQRPDTTEYAPYYANYVRQVPEGDIQTLLGEQVAQVHDLLRGISEAQAEARPAPGEWTLKEIIGHLSDVERVFAYRAHRFARQDATPLAGFEQDDYVQAAGYNRRTLADLVEEWTLLRQASAHLFRSLLPGDWLRRGQAGTAEFSVRAIAYILVGHANGHLTDIQTKYLGR